ncbi:hypothetical protein [Runella sp. SP2]|uniref:hypothetical protein n=1 Tax=Runella sp. SP2 TaxID=2268026 RepID=UPI000F07FFC9|nr:hypothetical protein [Runella sp. SP2]AYQ36573.1 hypothetical protein DTQ70_30085 [Runella sp. SP2]
MIIDLISSVLNSQSENAFCQQGQYEDDDIVIFEQSKYQAVFSLPQQCLWCNDSELMFSVLVELNQHLLDGYFELGETPWIAYWKRDFSVGI